MPVWTKALSEILVVHVCVVVRSIRDIGSACLCGRLSEILVVHICVVVRSIRDIGSACLCGRTLYQRYW